jgi:hypothetical protein
MRVFREDVLRCKKCGGRAAVISAIAQPKGVEAILVCLGLAVRAPPPPPRGRSRSTVRDSRSIPSGTAALTDRSPAAAEGNPATIWQFQPPRPAQLPPATWIERRG